MMATVPHVTSGLGLRKFQTDGFLLTRVCMFRPHTVAIFREVFFEGILHTTLQQFIRIEYYVLGERLKIYLLSSDVRIQSDILILSNVNFTVTPCINNIQHFNFQLIHTTLKNVELLKHFKIRKTAPTCFSFQGNHHQGATVNT